MIIDKNYALNTLGRTIDIRDTIRNIRDGLVLLKLLPLIKVDKPFKFLCSSTLRTKEIDLVTNGKGPNEVVAIASAYAELAERLSAYPESWHVSSGGINLLRQSGERRELFGRIYDHEYVEGCVEGRYKDFTDTIDMKALFRETKLTDKHIELIKEKSVLTKKWAPAKSVFEMDKIYYVPVHLLKWLNTTNGLAAGNSILEATLHGCMEVFERYVVTKFLESQEMTTPTINPDTLTDKYVVESLKYFEENNIEVVLKDLSMGLGIPAIGVITFNKSLKPGDRGYNTLKVGVSTNGRNAIMRALTERMQGTTFAEERMLGPVDTDRLNFAYMDLFNAGKMPLDLAKYKAGPVIPFQDWVYRDTDEAFEMIKSVLTKLETKLLVLDYTHKVLRFPVVQVIVPGVSDNIKTWPPEMFTLKDIGAVDEPLLKVEDSLERIYKSFF